MPPVEERINELETAIHNLYRELTFRGESAGGDSLSLYVDVGQFEHLDAKNWQVVWGRRGTGKTHLLTAFHQSRSHGTAETREILLYFSLNEFTLSPPGVTPLAKTLALGYFEVFFQRFVESLVGAAETLMHEERFVRRMRGPAASKMRLAEDAALRLLERINFGDVAPAFAQITVETLHEEREGRGSEIGGGVTVGAQGAALSVGVGASRRRDRNDSVKSSSQRSVGPDLPGARRDIISLLDLLDIKHVTLLLDEWSMLDPTGVTDVQPIFADLLKRFFGQSERFTIKIAANRFQTRFSSQDRGLQLNADIFEGLNLDRVQLRQGELVWFYRELLLRHLHQHSDIEFLVGADGAAIEGWEVQIFKSRSVFEELVRGAEGNPRNFLMMFAELARSRNFHIRPQWSLRDVRAAIAETSAERNSEMEFGTRTFDFLWGPIREVVLMTHQRAFYVRRDDLPFVRQLLDELLERRFIHDFPRGSSHAATRDARAYVLDYGTWLDWRATDEGKRGKNEDDNDVAARVLDLSEFRSAVVQCAECRHTFASDDPLYARRGLCPNRDCLAILQPSLLQVRDGGKP